MPSYDEGDHARAANLHIMSGFSYGDLTEVQGLPNSKGTVANWAQDGKGTDGTPWPEMKEQLEQEAEVMTESKQIEDRLAHIDEVAKEIGPLLREAAENLRTQLLQDGDANPTWNKYTEMLDRMRKVSQQKHVSDIHDRLERLAEDIGQTLGRQIQDDQVIRRIHNEIREAFNEAYKDIDELLGIDKE